MSLKPKGILAIISQMFPYLKKMYDTRKPTVKGLPYCSASTAAEVGTFQIINGDKNLLIIIFNTLYDFAANSESVRNQKSEVQNFYKLARENNDIELIEKLKKDNVTQR